MTENEHVEPKLIDNSNIPERDRCVACNGTGVRERIMQNSPAIRYCLECQGTGRRKGRRTR
jgi:DnaJ-class molecular chaperone